VLKARSLWYEYIMGKNSKEQVQSEIDAYNLEQADLFTRGKEMHDVYSEVNIDQDDVTDQFFTKYMGSCGYTCEFDVEAFQYYQDYLQKNPEKQQEKTTATNVNHKKTYRISEMS